MASNLISAFAEQADYPRDGPRRLLSAVSGHSVALGGASDTFDLALADADQLERYNEAFRGPRGVEESPPRRADRRRRR
jgi:hypothetical protein